ncbi:uncharacterized protein LOC134220081 [Armigeres subalbatus]|uniref:uncharacterized protein LOC134220081 n=1 Tax=Armigeres subalbatus TaxID=124917 RepID=UPI002ED27434
MLPKTTPRMSEFCEKVPGVAISGFIRGRNCAAVKFYNSWKVNRFYYSDDVSRGSGAGGIIAAKTDMEREIETWQLFIELSRQQCILLPPELKRIVQLDPFITLVLRV